MNRSLFGIAVFSIVTVMVSPCFLPNALAFRGERGGYVGGAAEETERVIVAGDRDAVCPGGVRNWHCPVEIQTTIEIRVREIDRVGMRRRDDVSSRSEVLRKRHGE